MFHESNNLNFQSEIFSRLRSSFLAHNSSSCISRQVSPRHSLMQLASDKPTSSIEYFGRSQRKKHHEIRWFFPTTADSHGDTTIKVRELPVISTNTIRTRPIRRCVLLTAYTCAKPPSTNNSAPVM